MKTKLNMIFRKDFKLHLYVVYTRFSTLWFDQRGFANIMGKHYLQSVHIKKKYVCIFLQKFTIEGTRGQNEKVLICIKQNGDLFSRVLVVKNSRSIFGGRREGEILDQYTEAGGKELLIIGRGSLAKWYLVFGKGREAASRYVILSQAYEDFDSENFLVM